jgi:hypothetical protein
MLQTDALFSFRDAVQLLDQKKHRVVGLLFRDILESVHLVEFVKLKIKRHVCYSQEEQLPPQPTTIVCR